MQWESAIFIYALPLVLIVAGYLALRSRQSRRAAAIHAAAMEAGLSEPPSLHPSIDPTLCLGCGSCASACPEGDVVGLIGGKAALIEPTHCIGHGSCAMACPTDAITLVFGTERRGIDIPCVGEDFQTNAPGVYIAGELGGMGLIRNAIEQGRQAMEAIRAAIPTAKSDILDTVIIGAAVAHYPRGKLVMTKPADLPIIGKVRVKDPSKERLLEFWRSVEKKSGVTIRYGERVSDIRVADGGFEVVTSKGAFRTRTVLLAIGRRGTPRKLDVPGEDPPKVVYRMIDPEQYPGRRVLVVGGGDSALEAAAEIAEQPGSKVICPIAATPSPARVSATGSASKFLRPAAR